MPFLLNNLGGTIHNGDIALLKFKYVNDVLKECTQLCFEKDLLPFEFSFLGVSESSLRRFFKHRITPETREGLKEALLETPIKVYDPERLIRYQKGRYCDDTFWLEPDSDDTCWKDVEHLK